MAASSGVLAGRAFVEVALKSKVTAGARQIQNELRALASNFRDLGGPLAAAGAGVTSVIGGALASLAIPVKFASDLESITAQFETLTGSVTKAKSIIGQLQALAASTPLETAGLAKATQTLLSLG